MFWRSAGSDRRDMSAGSQQVFVDGVGLWAPRLPGWEMAGPVLRGEASAPETPAARPKPPLLAPTERRRATDTVAIALEVAVRACEHAAVDPRVLSSVFACTHGDLATSDYLCATLAGTPTLVSPTRFHNSVHNAPAGYWSIGTGSLAPYTALAADRHTFGAGFLEAAVQVACESRPVLSVAYDVEARGPMATVVHSRGMLATALVLAPRPSVHSVARITWRLVSAVDPRPTLARENNAALVEGNALEACLVLFESLADAAPRTVVQTLTGSALELVVEPWSVAAPAAG